VIEATTQVFLFFSATLKASNEVPFVYFDINASSNFHIGV
jgi:hypothetical protein